MLRTDLGARDIDGTRSHSRSWSPTARSRPSRWAATRSGGVALDARRRERPPILAFWHDECLLHDTGSALFEAGPSPLLAVPELHPENASGCSTCARRSTTARSRRRQLAQGAARDRRRAAASTRRRTWRPSRRSPCASASSASRARRTPARRRRSRRAAPPARRSRPPTRRRAATPRSRTRCVRPPGHHAGPALIDGYCFFNNAALAAERLRDRGAERVAIVDWDVHHGNGTQACFWERADVLAKPRLRTRGAVACRRGRRHRVLHRAGTGDRRRPERLGPAARRRAAREAHRPDRADRLVDGADRHARPDRARRRRGPGLRRRQDPDGRPRAARRRAP